VNIRQLQLLREVVDGGFNMTRAAERLFTSQPGVSKQLRLLEEELGVALFRRHNRSLAGLTPAGEAVVEQARRALAEMDELRQRARELDPAGAGSLSLATTHTQARYALPAVVQELCEKHPSLELCLHQGTPQQIANMLLRREVDLGIATESLHLFEDLVLLPCYRWNRCVVVPQGHPLARAGSLTLEAMAEHPLITYVFGLTGRGHVNAAFAEAGLTPRVAVAAADAEVIKAYVRAGMGVGILARMAVEEADLADLRVLDAGHLFPSEVTSVALREGMALQGPAGDFIRAFAPHIQTRDLMAAERLGGGPDKQGLFQRLAARLPGP
jgi:LysR family cys regulon transcriptional activator